MHRKYKLKKNHTNLQNNKRENTMSTKVKLSRAIIIQTIRVVFNYY